MSIDTCKKEVGMMNLEKLIESREIVSNAAFAIPEKELPSRFEPGKTAAVVLQKNS